MGATNEGDRQAEILQLIRENGGRLTTARRAMVGAIVGADGHVTAEQIASTVQRDFPDVHLTTVYRFLDTLENLGAIDHVHLGHGRAVYHLAGESHHHLVCEQCGTFVEVPDTLFDSLGAHLLDAYGFAVRPHHFAIVGRCRDCRTGAS